MKKKEEELRMLLQEKLQQALEEEKKELKLRELREQFLQQKEEENKSSSLCRAVQGPVSLRRMMMPCSGRPSKKQT